VRPKGRSGLQCRTALFSPESVQRLRTALQIFDADMPSEQYSYLMGELIDRTYVPLRARRQEIPKDGGKFASCRSPLSVTEWYKARSSS
jgi:hypothetical protein